MIENKNDSSNKYRNRIKDISSYFLLFYSYLIFEKC